MRYILPAAAIVAVLFGLALVPGQTSPAAVAQEEQPETKTWTGTWNNRKFGTSGPLACTASRAKEDGTVEAVFTGKFKGDPFEYKVTFKAAQRGRQVVMAGTATVSGHNYEWQGTLNGDTFTGEYVSRNGNNGTFTMKERR